MPRLRADARDCIERSVGRFDWAVEGHDVVNDDQGVRRRRVLGPTRRLGRHSTLDRYVKRALDDGRLAAGPTATGIRAAINA